MSAPSAPPSRRIFFGLCAVAFLAMLSYAIAGSAAQSLFLEAYTSALLPWVWLAVAVASALCVAWVNRAAARLDVVRLFIAASGVSAVTLVALLAGHRLGLPGAPFALYVWKDIYIVVLVELFWTFANVAFGVHSASRSYGLFCAAGSVGAVVGSMALAPLVRCMGTFNTLWLVLPTLGATAWGCAALGRGLRLPAPPPRHEAGLRQGLGILRDSRYLVWMLVLVGVVQICLTVLDFQFNAVLETAYPDLDQRTGVLGHITAVINFVSFVLQMGTGAILRTLGLHGTLLGIPLVLAACVGAFVALPGFGTMALAKVASKSLDYSIFRAAKEILYIPLSYAEKTQGKAFVDMLTYRLAKGAVPLLLAVTGVGSAMLLGGINLALCAAWLGLTVGILRRYRDPVAPAATP